ncbi:peptidylprolyl isomerase [Aureispira anguillae]|uniref:peptidylprolyl isomerase n=1 Tax=Aureispira anguillae TaxID=2864201 RepID=A0A915YJN4_9BACT|nr:peptidylprolyl isomerase [Aureispira anguillae]BDS14450.1 peptidylprolyl isomerase [Aureispira anguillae]
MKYIISSIALLFLLLSCKKDSNNVKSSIEVNLEDAVIQQIFNFQNKRNTNALLSYLTVENPTHRYLAAMAFGSVQDTLAIKDLVNLLKDDYEEVRYAAAYALGQIKNTKAALPLANAFGEDTSRLVQAGILEAIGRCGTEDHLKYLSVTRPYPIQDSILLEGQATAIYRFALRGFVHKEGTTKIMNDFMANSLMSSKARFIAANYLARTKGINLSGYENVLINNVSEEKNPNTLMFLVTALAKSKTQRALKTLKNIYPNQKDYRIKCNILRSLKYFAYDSVKTVVFDALQDTNLHVKVTAAEYLYHNGTDLDAGKYYTLGTKHQNWQVRTKLLGAVLHNLSYLKPKTKAFYSANMIALYKKSENIYEQAALLKALGNSSWNYRFISNAIFPATDTTNIPEVIRSSGTEALVLLRESPYYAKELGLSRARINAEINVLLKRCIDEGDPAMQAIVANLLTNEEMDFKAIFTDAQFLKEAQSKLSLPRNIETHNILQKAINFIEGRPNAPINNQSSSFTEIDWPLIRVLKDNHKITIRTSKGIIKLKLQPEVAPATVTQFVHLAKAKYYDNKPFHRVVPNFVVQGGCSRGDGWSGFDVTVVSEFSNAVRYHDEGWVGMASAGKDTESAQFFITHAPTPHLDDNYTIFAKVIEGMNVVHQLQVGDKIISIDIN